MKVLYLIRGAPGSGKSTVAEALIKNGKVWDCIEADQYHVDPVTGLYNWKPERVREAHKWCQHRVESLMKFGHNLAVANTFTTTKQMKPYYELAQKFEYTVQEIVMRFPAFKNTHGVPEEKVKQYQERLEASLR
jgi:predicted kinase